MTFRDELQASLSEVYAELGEPMTLRRSGSSDASITAIRRDLSASVADADGVLRPVVGLEFTIQKSEYDFGAGAVEPARGDRLIDADGAEYDYPGDPLHRDLVDSGEWVVPVIEVA